MSTDPTEWRSEDTSDLLDTILALPDRPAAERFFRDLCTFNGAARSGPALARGAPA